MSSEDVEKYLVFVTKNGLIKKTKVNEFDSIRQNGKICINLRDDDELISVKISDGSNYIALCSSDGRMVIFNESEVRSMGRIASGVKGINMPNGSRCIGAEITSDDSNILIVTENGYGKKTSITEYRKTRRGSKGVKALNITEKNGNIAAFRIVNEDQDVIIITNSGMLIRMQIAQISQLGRVTQGVRLINLKNQQTVSTISIVSHQDDLEKELLTNPENETDN